MDVAELAMMLGMHVGLHNSLCLAVFSHMVVYLESMAVAPVTDDEFKAAADSLSNIHGLADDEVFYTGSTKPSYGSYLFLFYVCFRNYNFTDSINKPLLEM